MNTSFKPLDILAKPPMDAVRFAQYEPEEMEAKRGLLSHETIAILDHYSLELGSLVHFHKENDGANSTAVPSFDLAMRYALGVARKSLRVDVKKARGEWALRKLKLQAQLPTSTAPRLVSTMCGKSMG